MESIGVREQLIELAKGGVEEAMQLLAGDQIIYSLHSSENDKIRQLPKMSYSKGLDLQRAFPNFQPTTSVLKLLVQALSKNGNSIAMVEGETGLSVSRAALLRQSLRIAAGLSGAGVVAQDLVVLCCDKSIQTMAFLLGAIFTGATAVLAPSTHAHRIHELTQGHRVKAVFCDPDYQESVLRVSVPLMDPSPPLTAVLDCQDRLTATILNSSEEFDVFEVSDVSTHVPLVLFSGGTTGEPKGINISDLGLQLPGISLPTVNSILSAAPLFWYSSIVFLSASILQNFTLYFTNSRDVHTALKLVEKYNIDALFVSPGSLGPYCHELPLNTFDLSSIKRVILGGDIVLSTAAESFSSVFGGNLNLESIYGSTETGMLTQKCQYTRLGQCGYPLPGVEIKVVDGLGTVVPVGHVGHVTSRGLAVTPGYWGRALPLDLQGFFRTGDVGFMDEKGELYVIGRAVDIIVHQGVQISPWELEDVLMSHPGVLSAAVVGRPHASDGQQPVAFVVKRETSDVTEHQLLTFMEGKVGDTIKLRGVVFIDTIPLTIIGKINRTVLRERFCHRQKRHV